MGEESVLATLADRSGARRLLDLIGLSPGSGIPVSGGASRVLFGGANGFWVLDELNGARRAAQHSIEFVPIENVRRFNVELTDGARHSGDALGRLQGLTASLEYESQVIGGDTVVSLSAGILLEAVSHDEDAIRLWELVEHLLEWCRTAGIPLVVTASSE